MCSSVAVARFQEIAIRVFRTAHELAMHTVAIFSFEDRLSAHRQKVRVRASRPSLSRALIGFPLTRPLRLYVGR